MCMCVSMAMQAIMRHMHLFPPMQVWEVHRQLSVCKSRRVRTTALVYVQRTRRVTQGAPLGQTRSTTPSPAAQAHAYAARECRALRLVWIYIAASMDAFW